MKWFRQYPVFASLIATALAALIALSGTIAVLIVANQRSRTKLKKQEHEIRTFAKAGPLLNESAAKLICERTTALEQQNSERMRAYRSTTVQSGDSAACVPTDSTDAFFALTAFDERMSNRARAAGVKIGEDERFGFATYAKIGPETELIPAVHEQRLLVETVLDHLFAAHPEQLLAIARERPASQNRLIETTSPGAARDFFSFTPRHSLRAEGIIGGSAIRVSFVGNTSVLRDFVTTLVASESLLVVRGVEAEVVAGENDDQKTTVRAHRNPQQAVNRRTKFTVTVEALNFLQSAKPAAASL